jgi:hypothetical protein
LRNPNWKEDLVFVETNAFEWCVVALPKSVYAANGIATTPWGGQYIVWVRTLHHSVWSSSIQKLKLSTLELLSTILYQSFQ